MRRIKIEKTRGYEAIEKDGKIIKGKSCDFLGDWPDYNRVYNEKMELIETAIWFNNSDTPYTKTILKKNASEANEYNYTYDEKGTLLFKEQSFNNKMGQFIKSIKTDENDNIIEILEVKRTNFDRDMRYITYDSIGNIKRNSLHSFDDKGKEIRVEQIDNETNKLSISTTVEINGKSITETYINNELFVTMSWERNNENKTSKRITTYNDGEVQIETTNSGCKDCDSEETLTINGEVKYIRKNLDISDAITKRYLVIENGAPKYIQEITVEYKQIYME